jgi:hypothetical protein
MDIKLINFWNCLCDDFDYRLFVGHPFDELCFLFNSVVPEVLHFVPTINNKIAINLSNGISFHRKKVCLMIDSETLCKSEDLYLPMVILTEKDMDFKGFDVIVYDGEKSIGLLNNNVETNRKPTILVVNEKLL